METSNQERVAELTPVVERVLGAALEERVFVRDGHAFPGRTNVYRYYLEGHSAQIPASVIVKRAPDGHPYDPDATEFPAPAWFLFNNWAGSAFLQTVQGVAPIGPRFYGGDRDAGLIVVEDLGEVTGLHDLLQRTDPAIAEARLLQFAALLGRMHAETVGCEAEYNRLREALGPHARTAFYTYAWMDPAWKAAVDALALTPSSACQRELHALIAAMRTPGPFLAYTHGDPCPDNVLQVNGALRLIDFDVGGFRHALTDGVYGRMHFPTCWCVNRLPRQLPVDMERVYRTELVQGCPVAADDEQFYRAVVDACASWAIGMFHFTPLADLLREDRSWGIATLRQRYLLRLPIVAQLTEAHGHLEELGATLRLMADKLERLWRAEVDEVPSYVAFR